jgi:hypothetical protein
MEGLVRTKKDEQHVIAELAKDGRGILLKSGTFVAFNKNAIFIDPIHGEWTATPKNVIQRKTNHPIKSRELARQKQIETRKNNPDILKRTQETNLKRYGDICTARNSKVKAKAKKTNLSKYGAECIFSIPDFVNKSKETKLKKYGNPNFNNNKKAQKTSLQKYGCSNPMQSETVIQKGINTKIKKGIITRPTGLSWQELADELNVPRTSLQEAVRNGESIDEFLKRRSDNITNIEKLVIDELGIPKFVGSLFDGKYRPDFKIDETTYLNTDGLYWHSTKVKSDKKYHFKLREKAEAAGLKIYQFRSNEIKNKLDIVKSMVIKEGHERVFARKCAIVNVDAAKAKDFLNKNHLMGATDSKFIGLEYNGELVCLLGYKNKKEYLDVDRFCSRLNTLVIGGMSRLLKKAITISDCKAVHYWVDLRYGSGDFLLKLGFTKMRDVLGWQWTDFKDTYNRRKCRANMDSRGLTQFEHAAELKLAQIYDAGQRLYILNVK